MENARHLCLPEGKRTPTAIAYLVNIEICRYVDGCFPDAEASFDQIIDMISECAPIGNVGEEMHKALLSPGKDEGMLRNMPEFFYFPALCVAFAHDAMLAESAGDTINAWALISEATYWLGLVKGGGVYDNISRDIKSNEARRKADVLHDQPGGSRELARIIREIWAEGNFKDREACADQEWQAIGFGARKTARNALINTPNPHPWPAMEKKPSKC